eukprot:1185320-Prorocentrum_minimum.AAC.2
MVFSSGGGSEEWVQYDNANGMDYHFSTVGATTKPVPLHVMHVAVEMAPIAKVRRAAIEKEKIKNNGNK